MPASSLLSKLLIFTLGLCLSCGGGCSSKPPPVPTSSLITPASSPDTMLWNFAPNALVLHIKAGTDLNFVDEQAHTLKLCMYQLEKTEAFDTLAQTSEGLVRLMRCDRFDPSVRDMDSQIVTPGMVESQTFNRAEGARHVAVVAGYGKLEPGLVSRVWDVPAARHEEGSLFWKTTYYYPGPLEMIILLGPSSLQRYLEPVGE